MSEVLFLTNEKMEARWEAIEAALRAAFRGARFIDPGYTDDTPVDHTRDGIHGKLRDGLGLGHVLAVDGDRVLGGFFCIPTERTPDEIENDVRWCDVGWVFVSHDAPREHRAWIMDTMLARAYAALKEAGFEQIVSNMGTRAGAKSLEKNYGFVDMSTDEQPNRWVRDLTGS